MSNIKNVEAFEKLTGICTGYGGSYKPGQLNLNVSAMATLLNQARQAINDAHTNQTHFDNATNAREEKFKAMVMLSVRVLNTLKASGASPLTVQDAQASVRKMMGRKLPAPVKITDGKAAAEPKVKTRTARGLDYGSLADHFAKLAETISAEPNYKPYEAELAPGEMANMLASLRNLNTKVNEATANLNKSRMDRSALLYSGANNIVATAKAVKHYVRAAYGAQSAQSKEVGRIRFTKQMK